MNATEMKLRLRGNGVPQWELAEMMGISEATLTRRFRTFTEAEAAQMEQALQKIIKKRGGAVNV
jgi:DNA-binding Lrp family transcriptional regulator